VRVQDPDRVLMADSRERLDLAPEHALRHAVLEHLDRNLVAGAALPGEIDDAEVALADPTDERVGVIAYRGSRVVYDLYRH